MTSSVYFPNAPRLSNGRRSNGRRSAGLPVYSTSSFSSSVVQEKFGHRNLSPWLISIPLPLPGVRFRLRLLFLNPRRLHQSSVSRFGQLKGSLILSLGFLGFLFFIFALAKRFGTPERKWPRLLLGDPPTLIYRREDLQRIWQWEIASGHYPSHSPSKQANFE
jgi:DDB1- and CUL4-associated factor 13